MRCKYKFYLIKWEMAFAVGWLHAHVKYADATMKRWKFAPFDCLLLIFVRVVDVCVVWVLAKFRTFDTYNCHYLCNESTLNLSQLEPLLLAPSCSKFWSDCNYLQICAELARQNTPTIVIEAARFLRVRISYLCIASNAMLIWRRRSSTKLAQSLAPADNDNDNVRIVALLHSLCSCTQWRSNIYKSDKSTFTIIIANNATHLITILKYSVLIYVELWQNAPIVLEITERRIGSSRSASSFARKQRLKTKAVSIRNVAALDKNDAEEFSLCFVFIRCVDISCSFPLTTCACMREEFTTVHHYITVAAFSLAHRIAAIPKWQNVI